MCISCAQDANSWHSKAGMGKWDQGAETLELARAHNTHKNQINNESPDSDS